MKTNNRLSTIPEYELNKLDSIKNHMIKDNKRILDLGIGDPDLAVEDSIIKELIDSCQIPRFNNYSPYEGIKELKKEVINYYKKTFEVNLKENQVLILIGSKEGLSNIIPAVCDVGDYVIIPKPSYPIYELTSRLWGTIPYKIPLKIKNNYLPNIGEIPKEIVYKSKLFIINYPNNPTGALANEDFYKEIVEFSYKNNIVVCNDGAYNEILRGTKYPLSLMQLDKKKNCVEFGTFSKIYNMTGFRLGYVVGNSDVLDSILKIKMNMDSSQFIPIQRAGIKALNLSRGYINKIRNIYDNRIEITQNLLQKHNIGFSKSEGTFYIWCNVPEGYTTDEFCIELLKNYGIIVTPGYVFGNLSYGHFRIAVTKDIKLIEKAFDNLQIYK
ncbi:aminotransferase class I/II-fold pyridoxal phosphate-dependent enzyme [Clostridium rectalis]|uniref:aminotransferase class I/II-fold pyridoxal phosphate-dependent enzyme n=1 Tax=Clostridium rectalis TaxID=2040295 RepID=UPI001FAA8F31|nr:aminotransferase class I/II-fold pyridoxal phosphate-dependent enzyme [Clostridium rectalis]